MNAILQSDEDFRKWLKTEYHVGKRLGKGAFSRVYFVKRNEDGIPFALKVKIKKKRKTSCVRFVHCMQGNKESKIVKEECCIS